MDMNKHILDILQHKQSQVIVLYIELTLKDFLDNSDKDSN